MFMLYVQRKVKLPVLKLLAIQLQMLQRQIFKLFLYILDEVCGKDPILSAVERLVSPISTTNNICLIICSTFQTLHNN